MDYHLLKEYHSVRINQLNFEKIVFGSLLEHAWDLLIDFRKVLGGSGRVLGWFWIDFGRVLDRFLKIFEKKWQDKQ